MTGTFTRFLVICCVWTAASRTCRDVVQPPVFVTAALERKYKKNLLSPGHVSACNSVPPVYNTAKHKICASPITRNVDPCSRFEYRFLLSAYALPFFSCPIKWNRTSLWHWWLLCAGACPASRDIDGQVTVGLHENFVVPFSILFPLETALIEKPMFVQVGSFCTSNLQSGPALQQDFVIRKVGWKHCIMNILAAVHFALYFSFAVIMSEINPTDHKSIIARHIQRNNTLVGADF